MANDRFFFYKRHQNNEEHWQKVFWKVFIKDFFLTLSTDTSGNNFLLFLTFKTFSLKCKVHITLIVNISTMENEEITANKL